MIDHPCPVCANRATHVCFDQLVDPTIDNRTWIIARCTACDGHFLLPRPRPSELVDLYPHDYEPFQMPVDDEPSMLGRWLRRRHYRLRARLLHRACPTGGIVLDIGCATGNFLHEVCRDSTWRGIGCDLSARALTVARSQHISVWCGEATDIALPDAVCDAVTLWEVIEHVPDPQATLAEVRRVLRPGGTLLLSTPNGASWQAQHWGRYWAGWDPPRHLQVFSFPFLQQLLRTSGLQITRRRALPFERFYLVDSIRRWLRSTFPPTPSPSSTSGEGSRRSWVPLLPFSPSGRGGRGVRGDARPSALPWPSQATERLAILLGLAAWPLLWLLDRLWPVASAIVLEARAEE